MQSFFPSFMVMKSKLPTAKFRRSDFANHRLGRILSLSVVISCWGCKSTLPNAPTWPSPADGFHDAPIETPPGLGPEEPPVHTILPGDILRLQIMSAESYAPAELWVSATGHIHVPFGGDVQIAGLTLDAAELRVQDVVRKYDKYARVTLTVHSFAGHHVIIHGAVDKPGSYEARPGLRVAEVVISAGGIRVNQANTEATDMADIDAARIVRLGKTVPISLKLALLGEVSHNVYVRPGDIIFIPWATSRQIPVLGNVRAARNVAFRDGLRLTEALAAAGGPDRSADTADIRIIRGPLSRAKVYCANLNDVMNGSKADVVLAPGDVVFVTEHWFATTAEVLQRLTPVLAAATVYSVFAR
jgi:polysaccharide biosynthesis/export protein